jgi:antitoxin component YwqK of YwqJK toxin-antitoxin module
LNGITKIKTLATVGMPTIEDEGVMAERSFNGVTTSIYPNPNNGSSVNLNVDGMEGMLQVKVTDATGKLIQRSQYAVEGSLNTILNFDQKLSNGLYLVELTNGQQSQTMRMMVNR